MSTLEETICELTSIVLKSMDRSANWEANLLNELIEKPPNPEMGDYALPCFTFAKILRRSPLEIAKELAEKLQSLQIAKSKITSIKATGSYLNFTVSASAMAEEVLPSIFNGSYFMQPSKVRLERVMIEYSQPNTHKGFHVGHMRNVAIGDTNVNYRLLVHGTDGSDSGDVTTRIAVAGTGEIEEQITSEGIFKTDVDSIVTTGHDNYGLLVLGTTAKLINKGVVGAETWTGYTKDMPFSFMDIKEGEVEKGKEWYLKRDPKLPDGIAGLMARYNWGDLKYMPNKKQYKNAQKKLSKKGGDILTGLVVKKGGHTIKFD